MEALDKRINELRNSFFEDRSKAGIEELEQKIEAFSKRMESPDFWANPAEAAEVSKQLAGLEQRIKPWNSLKDELAEAEELVSMNDASIQADITQLISKIEADYGLLKKELRFDGPFDHGDAILSIYAGAGGTDAQDWTAMLFRMYSRWFERSNLKITIIEESVGDEAGLKSVTAEVSGNMAYGKLKNEHGVHRLVRLSPFNADNLRQTSFAKVEVLPKIDKPEQIKIQDKDLKIDVYRSGGHGGQSVNTTDSAVRITHLPTGISVAIQNERSQLQNKEAALTILRSKLTQLQLEQHAEEVSELKGPNEQAAWGNQIRNYVLHPYKLVKDLRSGVELTDVEGVLDGKLDDFINA